MKVAHLPKYMVINITLIILVTTVRITTILGKKKYKPYEEISGEFKKIKPPTFNGETKKGEEAKS